MTKELSLELARRAVSIADRIEALAAEGLLPPMPKNVSGFEMLSIIRRAEALRDGRDPDAGAIYAITADPN